MKTKILFIALLMLVFTTCKNNSQVSQDKIYERLFDAIREDGSKTFDLLVEHLPDIDSLVLPDIESEISYTPLGWACMQGRYDFVEKLLKLKADVNRGQEGEYYAYDALNLAIQSNDERTVKLLLDNGANPNVIYGEYGDTPLTLNVQSDQNNQISKMLIIKGANIDGAGDLGFENGPLYPLFSALKNNNTEMARYLIEKGCRLDIVDEEGTLLSWVQEKGDKELESLIMQHLKKNYKYRVDKSWYGDYEYETPSYTDGLTTISQTYTLEVLPDSCVFSGIGFQLYFIEKCTAEQTASDTLTIRFYNLIDGESTHYTEPYAVKLFRKGGKYYFNSPFIFGDTESDVDLEAIKTESGK